MQNILGLGARITGITGAVVCLVSGAARIAGHSYLAGFESMTLFVGGIALMVCSVVLKLESLRFDAGN